MKSIFNIHKINNKLHFLFVWSVVYLVATTNANSQNIANTGAIDDDISAVSDLENATVWSAPAEQKIRPNDRVETNNLVWSAEKKMINVAGAKNEHVPFQVVITTSVAGSPRHVESPDGFFIEASDLKSSNGDIISKENINFFIEHYILLSAKSSPVGETGFWPDGLAPLKVPFNMNTQYRIVKNRPIWVDILVPKGLSKGKYSGTITVTQHGNMIEALGIELQVYNFSLPDETPLITYMNVSRAKMATYYNKPSDSDEIENLTQKYYDFIYANRMEPWFNDMLTPEVVIKGKNVNVKFDHEKYLYFMNDLKTKRVLLHCTPSVKGGLNVERGSDEYFDIIKSYLKQVESYFEQNGWKESLVFNSPVDEPRSLEDYDNTREWAALVKETTTDIPFLITRTPVPPEDHPEWGAFQGYVDNYSVHGNHMSDPELKRVIEEEKARGGEITWYISCDQKYPQPNYFIDAPAMDLVMVPWITARYKMDGILYWALNHWHQSANPWMDANSFLSGFLCSGGWVLNGEGYLLYPGDQTELYTGQPYVDGPVSSIRFELLREGIEDYVYLSMLDELGDKEFASDLVKDMVIDVKAFTRNVEVLYNTRKAMAKRLEELSQ